MPVLDTNITAKNKTDSAKDIKEAFALLVNDASQAIGSDRIVPDYKKLVFVAKCPGRDISIAVKKGCSGLGRKNSAGEWVYSDEDITLYTPELDPEKPFRSQFRVFEKGEFLKMWQELDLVRYKVSTSGVRHLRGSGHTGPASIEKYADYISVQSFSNSRRKTAALTAYLEAKPLAIEHRFYQRFFGEEK